MNNVTKGSIYAIVSAASYGLNPLGGLMLGREGMNTHTILFSRFTLAVAILAAIIAFRTIKGGGNGMRERLRQGFVLHASQRIQKLPLPCELQGVVTMELEFAQGGVVHVRCDGLSIHPLQGADKVGAYQC